MTNRRDFISMTAMTAGGLLAGCRLGRTGQTEWLAKPEYDFMWGELVHFGMNNFSTVEVKSCFYPGGLTEAQREIVRKQDIRADHVRFDEAMWREVSAKFKASGVNAIVIDVAESLAYPSHPELAVKGSWSPDKMRDEIARLRGMGFEVIPKMNFSTTHDCWLKDYHLMVGTRKYYEVVRDVIADVSEVFGRPRLFHVGLDEEVPQFQAEEPVVTLRGLEKWWQDLKFYQGEVERHGSRMWMWSDYFRHHDGDEAIRDFCKHMSKAVLQCPWWYQWINRPAFDAEKRVEVRNYRRLSDLGYEFTLCGSNCYACDTNFEDTVAYCRDHLNAGNCKGFLFAPWLEMHPGLRNRWEEGADQVARARALWRR